VKTLEIIGVEFETRFGPVACKFDVKHIVPKAKGSFDLLSIAGETYCIAAIVDLWKITIVENIRAFGKSRTHRIV